MEGREANAARHRFLTTSQQIQEISQSTQNQLTYTQDSLRCKDCRAMCKSSQVVWNPVNEKKSVSE